MDICGWLPQGYLHSLTLCHGLVAIDVATCSYQPLVQLFHYISYIMLTPDSLSDIETVAHGLHQALQGWGWAINEDKMQGPGYSVKLLGVSSWVTKKC